MLSGLSVKRAILGVVPLSVNVTNDAQINAATIPSAYSGVRIDADNNVYSSDVNRVYTVHDANYVVGGVPGDVWVERTINSGALNVDDIGGSRVVCSTSRTLEVVDTTDDGSPVTCNVTVDYYDASSGGNLLGSATYSLSAERTGV